jgi:transposase-like protein
MAPKRRRIRCPFCQSMRTIRYGSFALKKAVRGGKKKRRRRWYCNDCQRAFTPYQMPSEHVSSLVYQAAELYYDSKASYRDVARKLGIHRSTAYRLISGVSKNCKTPCEVNAELKPHWSGYLIVDGDAIDVGTGKKILLLGVDSYSQDILHALLVNSEDGHAWSRFLSGIQQIRGYTPPGVVSDGFPALIQGIHAVYPHRPRQLCVQHFEKDLTHLLRYRFTQKPGHWRQNKRLLGAVHRMLYANSLTTAQRQMDSISVDSGFQQAGFSGIIKHIKRQFPHLVTHHCYPGMPRTNSIIEGVISRLDERIDPADGYGSHKTCWTTVKMLIMWYRFKQFTDCRKKNRHKNGKSPIQLAGVDASDINWIRYSQNVKNQQ